MYKRYDTKDRKSKEREGVCVTSYSVLYKTYY